MSTERVIEGTLQTSVPTNKVFLKNEKENINSLENRSYRDNETLDKLHKTTLEEGSTTNSQCAHPISVLQRIADISKSNQKYLLLPIFHNLSY